MPAPWKTRLNICGFETRDFSEVTAITGTGSISTTTFRSGLCSLRTNPVGAAVGSTNLGAIAVTGSRSTFNIADLYVRVYFRYATKPTTGHEFFLFFESTPTLLMKLGLGIDLNGVLKCVTNSTTETGTKVLAANTWYCIEAYCGTGNPGSYEVLVNGVREFAGSADVIAENHRFVYFGKKVNTNSNTVDFFFDDIAITSDGFPGPGRVVLLVPTAGGTHLAWTGTVAEVDDWATAAGDGTTTKITSAINGDKESVLVSRLGSAGVSQGAIAAVKAMAQAADSGGASLLKVFLRSNGVEDPTTGIDMSTTYTIYSKLFNIDPSDSSFWTFARVNALEVGVISAAAVEHRVTALGIGIEYNDEYAGFVHGSERTSPIGYRRVEVSWRSIETGGASEFFDGLHLPSLSGWILDRFVTVPAIAPASPNDNYNVRILDTRGDDVLDDKGLLRDAVNTENVPFIQSPSHGNTSVRVAEKTLSGRYKLVIDGAGVGAEGRVILYLLPPSAE